MTDPARQRRVVAICSAALDRSGDDRNAFVSAACGDDEHLRLEVDALLMEASSGPLVTSVGSVAAHIVSELRRGSLVGRHLGPYTILSYLGAGGMGEVYRAHDPRLARNVAIKILPGEFPSNADRRRRFQRESQAIASLNHPHICVVHDVGHQDGVSYLVMEFLKGQTLKERLVDEMPLSVPDVLTVAIEIASALVEAHRHGIIHRDVKPGNIMLTARGAKLLDFGLARTLEGTDLLEVQSTAALTASAVILGTPSYMSPEQALGQPVDARSDVFSFGAVIYEMVTARRPFNGVNAIETIDAVLHEQPPNITTVRPDAPAELGALVQKCLTKDKDLRYQSMEHVWSDLTVIHRGSTPRIWIAPATVRRHNLPVQVTSFVGRESDVTDLCSLFSDTRLVTLSGSGGCGKTRLGLKVASSLIDSYGDGVWLVELSAVSDGKRIPQAVASALGVDEEPGRPLPQRIADYLEAKHLLLVLDNCEHLVAAAAQFVEAILRSAEGVRVLATSREPLRLSGERVWRVASLSFPDSAPIPLSEAAEYEAVRLFVDRAQSAVPFRLDDRNATYVGEICRRLDGIPLALEMAAARLDVLSVEQIAGRLNDRFRLLTRTHRTSLPRHETLQSAIDWSYELLDAAEQTLFRRLAVFAGTFSLEATERVCSDRNLRSNDVFEVLSRLVVKSMVTISRTSLGVRYRLLETVREYALDKLERNAADERRTRNRHLEFFLALAEPLEAQLFSRLTARVYDRVEQDHQNLLAALDWCRLSPRRSEAGLRLVSSLRPFWAARCYHQLATQLSQRALDFDQRRSPKQVLVKALASVGYFLRISGEFDPANRAFEESLRLANEATDYDGAANALWELGIVAAMQGRESEAEPLLSESLAISRQHGLKLTMARALDSLGLHAFLRGDYALARAHSQESHDLFRGLGFEIGLTISLFHQVALESGVDGDKARSLALEALTKARETGHQGHVLRALNVLGDAYFDTDHKQSRVLYEEALSIARAVGYKRFIANSLSNLGRVSMIEENYVEAERQVGESLAILAQLHEDRSSNAAEDLAYLGWIALEQGRFEHALELFRRASCVVGVNSGLRNLLLRLSGWAHLALADSVAARAAFEESRSYDCGPASFAGVQLGIGYVDLLANRVDDATRQFQSALSVYDSQHITRPMIDAILGLGAAFLAHDQFEEARLSYLRALRMSRELGQKKNRARALRGLGIVASRQQQPVSATRCFAAAATLLRANNIGLASFELSGYEPAMSAVRAALGSERFQLLWDEGCAISIDRIEEFVCSSTGEAGMDAATAGG